MNDMKVREMSIRVELLSVGGDEVEVEPVDSVVVWLGSVGPGLWVGLVLVDPVLGVVELVGPGLCVGSEGSGLGTTIVLT